VSGTAEDWLGGLPGPLPAGERILWQGRPEWRGLLDHALHARLVAVYFALLTLGGLLMRSPVGAAVTAVAGILCLGLLALFANLSARTSVYTLTDRRIVLRVGVALPMSFNLPLSQIEAADLRMLSGGRGDVALRLEGSGRIAWALLWPHVRPWRMRRPEPMLRAIPGAEAFAIQLYKACAAVVAPETVRTAPVNVRRPVRAAPEPAGVAA
jgi:hypothetical protein